MFWQQFLKQPQGTQLTLFLKKSTVETLEEGVKYVQS